jgi:hypothetical protein
MNDKLHKITSICLTALFLSNPTLSFSATTIADKKDCEKATGISTSLGVSIAENYKISAASVNFISTYLDKKYSMCYLKVDTSIGPKSCLVSHVFTDGKDFWVGGSCN